MFTWDQILQKGVGSHLLAAFPWASFLIHAWGNKHNLNDNVLSLLHLTCNLNANNHFLKVHFQVYVHVQSVCPVICNQISCFFSLYLNFFTHEVIIKLS